MDHVHQFLNSLDALEVTIDGEVRLDDYREILDKTNKRCRYGTDSQARFVGSEGSALVPPIPMTFTGTGDRAQVVVVGLNPHYSLKNVPREKEAALEASWPDASGRDVRGTWRSYANWYLTSRDGSPPGHLRTALESRYYPVLGHVVASLRYPMGAGLHVVPDLRNVPKDEQTSTFWREVKDVGVASLEYIPFHSAVTATGTRPLVRDLYKAYHDALFTVLKTILSPNGYLIANGSAPSELVSEWLGDSLTSTTKFGSKAKSYVVGAWGCRRVSLLRSPLTSRPGLNGYTSEIGPWLERLRAVDVSETCVDVGAE